MPADLLSATAQGGISVRDVTKIFASGSAPVTALEDVTLEIAPGRTTVLIGPSGCGKSTLLNMFAGLDHPTKGDIVVNGGASEQGRVGTMFQRSSLLPWRSALANVLLPAEILGLPHDDAKDRALQLLRMVGLEKWTTRYPAELSGGMQQRVALARVLLPDPDIILLDEPFGALDEMTREALDIEMCRITERTQKTIVMVTHSIYEAVLVADAIAVLSAHPGRLQTLIDVPLPRPREISMTGSEEFSELVGSVRHAMRNEVGGPLT